MVRTASTMLPLGTSAPDFRLLNINGERVSLDSFKGSRGLVVVFMCNHCPYVKHIAPELTKVSNDYMAKGIAFVGISSNDVVAHPDDSPEMMKLEAANRGYQFPYLYDPTQEVAVSYRAACTPDFFAFDGNMKLVYRGQLDDSRPKTDKPLTGKDLRNALDCILSGESVPEPHRPSIGCNIKWLQDKQPDYFNAAGIQA
ncbi:MAG: thioredoxin family protein [Planctomycetota bacterium]|nr:thioredoxin family protein [Planctomycetota bacterium]